MVRYGDAKELRDLAAGPLRPLLVYAAEGTAILEHAFCVGAALLENWREFDKMEVSRERKPAEAGLRVRRPILPWRRTS